MAVESSLPVAGNRRSDLAGSASRTPWLVGPWTDLLLLANVTWPLIFLLGLWGGFDAHEGVRFWQIYFVTMPHRWITLALVFLDRQQFRQQPGMYLGLAILATLICSSVWLSTGTLMCLLAIDYVWNAWHFAAQHHGVLRIYGRLAEPARTASLLLEKVAMRGFLLYVIVRVAGGTWPSQPLEAWLAAADWVLLIIPALLLLREVVAVSAQGVGRIVYLTSVLTLYVVLLLSVHYRQPQWMLPLVTASALFHATEYLTLVSWAVRRKHGTASGDSGLFRYLAPQWGLTLAAFAIVLGLGGWLANQYGLQIWLLINVIVAYLHYAYDGMIWKLRRPVSYAN